MTPGPAPDFMTAALGPGSRLERWVWPREAMSVFAISIFLLGGALGLFMGVRALLLALAAWGLTLAASAALGRLENFGLWLAAGVLLQCGYFAGLALRALLEPRAPRAAREKPARPRGRDAERDGV